MPVQEKKYTLMWIPRDGLFYDGGAFLDGRQQRVKWDRIIRIFPSYSRAETAKNRILREYPEARGELVVLPVSVKEIPEEDGYGREED